MIAARGQMRPAVRHGDEFRFAVARSARVARTGGAYGTLKAVTAVCCAYESERRTTPCPLKCSYY